MLGYALDHEIELRLLMPHHAAELSRLGMESYDDGIAMWVGEWIKDDADTMTDHMLKRLKRFGELDMIPFGIFYQGQLVGGISYNYFNWRMGRTDIGYWLAKDYRGKGIVTRAVEAMTHYAFSTLKLNRIEISASPLNAASVAIPKRLGYQFETRREEWLMIQGDLVDMDVYVMLAPAWKAAHANATPIPSLLTKRLNNHTELRLMMPYHAAAYTELVLRDQDDLSVWLGWTKPFDLEKAQDQIKRWLQRLGENDGLTMGIFYEGRFAGWINYHYWNWRNKRTELGYWLGVDYRGKGIMTEAVRVMTDYALRDLQLNRVEVLMDTQNERSSAVPRRLNFKHEGIRQGYYQDNEGNYRDADTYYMLARDWK